MSQHKSLLWSILALVLLVTSANAQQDPDRWTQEFLFMLDDAYTQAQGQWQVSAELGYLQNRRTAEYRGPNLVTTDTDELWKAAATLAYGLTDTIQADLYVPYGHISSQGTTQGVTQKVSGYDFGDITTGLTFKLMDQDHDNWLPTLAFKASAVLPTSDDEKGMGKDAYGWIAGLNASKAVDDFFWHGNVAYGRSDDTREFGQSYWADEKVLSCGAALVFSPTREYDLICETYAEFETEESNLETEHRSTWYLIPGAKYHLSETTDIGLSVPIGVGGDSYDWGVVAKVMFEW